MTVVSKEKYSPGSSLEYVGIPQSKTGNNADSTYSKAIKASDGTYYDVRIVRGNGGRNKQRLHNTYKTIEIGGDGTEMHFEINTLYVLKNGSPVEWSGAIGFSGMHNGEAVMILKNNILQEIYSGTNITKKEEVQTQSIFANATGCVYTGAKNTLTGGDEANTFDFGAVYLKVKVPKTGMNFRLKPGGQGETPIGLGRYTINNMSNQVKLTESSGGWSTY